jgi:hypothetical protein
MRINRREMAFLLLGGVLVFALFYYLLLVSPALSRQKVLDKSIGKMEGDLVSMIEMKRRWDGFRKSKTEAEKILNERGKEFTLLSFLEGVSRKVGIHKKIQYMKPVSTPEEGGIARTVGMEIKLDGMSVGELVNFLYEVEYSGNLLNTKRIKIQKLSKGETGLLRVTVQVNTFRAV